MGVNPDGTERQRLDQLPRVAQLAGWPSPKASNTTGAGTRGEGGDNLQTVAGWATPRANENCQGTAEEIAAAGSSWKGQRRGATLSTEPKLAAPWATPDAQAMNDGESLESRQVRNKEKHGNGNGAGMPLAVQCKLSGLTPAGSSASTGSGGAFQLNPAFSLWLMGFPTSWHAVGVCALRCFAELGTPSCRKSRRSSSGPSTAKGGADE